MKKLNPILLFFLSFFFSMLLVSNIFSIETPSIDKDADGLPDIWELKYTKNDLTKMDADSDYDNDGISNKVEYELGTDPTVPDRRGPRITYQYDALGRIIKIERIPSK